MATQEPIEFCNEYPAFSVEGKITLPFGLPEISYDTSCVGIFTSMGDINANLAAIYPIISVANCILKVIEVVQAIPDSIGPPPDPTVLIQKIAELGDCINLLLQFSGWGAIPTFCALVRDLINFTITILGCLAALLQVAIDCQAELTALQDSTDPRLQEAGECLATHCEGLGSEIEFKFEGIGIFVSLINAMLSILPPPLGGTTIGLPSGGLNIDASGVEAINALIEVLEAAVVPFEACAGGS